MENSNPIEKASWFSDISWKTACICAAVSILLGGGTGAGVVASKAVEKSGVSQDQADVRYVTKTEAAASNDLRDKQLEEIRRNALTREVFTAYMESIKDEQTRQRQLLEKLLERQ